MNSYKYFKTAYDYDQWFSKNYKHLLLVDITKVDSGAFLVEYIQTNKQKPNRRNRIW